MPQIITTQDSDSKGNIIHTETEASVVTYKDNDTVENNLNNLNNREELFVTDTKPIRKGFWINKSEHVIGSNSNTIVDRLKNYMDSKIGVLSDLLTIKKDNLVEAINENTKQLKELTIKTYTSLSQIGLKDDDFLNKTQVEIADMIINAMPNDSILKYKTSLWGEDSNLAVLLPEKQDGILNIFKKINQGLEFNYLTNTNIMYCSFFGNWKTPHLVGWKQLATTESINNPNLLINGDFQVWQRGDKFTLSKYEVKYTADRVRFWCNSESGLKVTRDNGLKVETTDSCMYYVFEDDFFKELANKQLTFCMSINNKVITKSFIFQLSDEWTQLAVDTEGGISIAIVPQHQQLEIAISKNITFNWWKLELGSVATPFVHRLYGEELDLCKRYYQSNSDASWYQFHRTAGGGLRCDIPTKSMRTKPTLIFNNDNVEFFNNNGMWEKIDKNNIVVSGNYSSQITLYANTELEYLKSIQSYIAKGIPSFDSEIY